MTALADRRLPEHLADADERELDRLAALDRLMREPGGLPSVPEPVPLCRTGRGTSVFSAGSTAALATSSTTNVVTDSATTSIADVA